MRISDSVFLFCGLGLSGFVAACALTDPPATASQSSGLVSPPPGLGLALRRTPLVAQVKVLAAVGRPGTMGAQRVEAIFTDLTLKIETLVRADATLDPAAPIMVSTLGGT